MNGVSHGGLFKASRPPEETEPEQLSPWLLNCFYTIVKTVKNKRASQPKPAQKRYEPKDNKENQRTVLLTECELCYFILTAKNTFYI